MKQVVVREFGTPDVLQVQNVPTPYPGPGEVLVRLTSIGMNYAEIMERRGHYRILSGDPPFVPGLEGGGVIEAVGDGVPSTRRNQHVVLGIDAPRAAPRGGEKVGTYRSHFICPAEQAIPAPDCIPESELGCLWLPFLTAWGCLIWQHKLQPGGIVCMPAASSSVAMAASQIARRHGCTTIGMTTSPGKVETLKAMPEAHYDHLLVTRDNDWRAELKEITKGHGVDVFFDPVAAGDYLNDEIRSLAKYGTIWVYGLLGEIGKVDVTPLIRKHAAIRGWAVTELANAGPEAFTPGYRHILDGFASGDYSLHVARAFPLDQVVAAHTYMEQGKHIGKLVLIP